jgi:hemolysin-activating ACP:hemolysin acyltransferase
MNILSKKFDDIYKVIALYKSFDKYKYILNEQLFFYLLTTFNNKQCKVFYTDKKVTGFISWSYMDEKNSEHFKKTGEVLDWNCGNIVWLVDVLAIDGIQSIMKWTKNHFTKELGTNQRVNYIRMDNDLNIYRISSQSTKAFYG